MSDDELYQLCWDICDYSAFACKKDKRNCEKIKERLRR